MAQEAGKKKGNKKLFIILFIIILVFAGVLAYFYFNKKAPVDPEEALDRGVITEDNVDEIIEQMSNAEPAEIGYYTVTMNTEWHFANGKEASYDAYVENSTKNETPVYFDLFLAEDESEPIYMSPVIPLGKSLDKIKLEKNLDPGTYDCVMVYHLVDDDQNTLSTLRVSVTVIVEG